MDSAMPKICFLGAGSSVFVKNVLGDAMMTPALHDSEISLYDVDGERLRDSGTMLEAINRSAGGKAHIRSFLGTENRREALRGADYVVNAVQVGGYRPCTVTDFELPARFGLRQTIGDTLGIGGIFRGLRTIPVIMDFARDMEEVCPEAWLLNYSNPMAMLTGAVQRHSGVKAVGLCHSVQICVPHLMRDLEMPYDERVQWKIAGINHMGWLLEVSRDGKDLYPEIRRRALEKTGEHRDMVRYEIMRRFGFYVTESSEHNAEYTPYFIKNAYPELISRFNIPLDEYPRRCEAQISSWQKQREELVMNPELRHERSHEYAASIMEAMETNIPYKFGGNVQNSGLIDNLPRKACVEVACYADAGGITPGRAGALPTQLAALNQSNISVHLMTIEAAMTRRRDAVYQAALLDPHTAAELSIDDIVALCDALIERHGDWLPAFA